MANDIDLSDLFYMRGHLHLTFRIPIADGLLQLVPGFADEKMQADVDIKFVDRDGDGNPEVEVRWDLPGTALDSGPDAKGFEVPKDQLMGPMNEVVGNLLEKADAPLAVVEGIKALF